MSANDDLYELIDRFCTASEIADVLREAKGTEGVRITAENKNDLIQRNLRTAIEQHAIASSRAYDLLRDGEENGDQHVFYFRSRAKRFADSLTFDTVGKALFKNKWPDGTGLPTITLHPQDYVISDYRQWNPSKKPKDWVFKVYGQEVREHYTGNSREEGTAVWKQFERLELRHVLIARWNAPNLLEFRVPREDGKTRILGWVETLWKMLAPVLTSSHFEPWDLSHARRRLIEEEEQHTKLYRFQNTQLEDSNHARASFEPYTPDANLFTAVEMKDAIQGLLRANSACTRLALTWLKGNDGVPSRDLRTYLGKSCSNEMVVAGQCKPKDLEHVTEQLR